MSAPFFNPSLGQDVAITFVAPVAGSLTATVVDRDGYRLRYLARQERIAAGQHVIPWNGKDDAGAVVPDEAYSLKLDLVAGNRHLVYFPALRSSIAARTLRVRSYDPRTGIISYELPGASRVHIQAGSAVVDAKGHPNGPVLKTVVDEQPRAGGTVVEHWNGFDESGTIYVPDQPNFVMSLVAAPLPENSIITVGNRANGFLDYVARRRGASVIPLHASHAHHVGLPAIDDVAPPLQIRIANGVWSGTEKAWHIGQEPVRVAAQLQGPLASRFAERSTEVQIFVDNKPVLSRRSGSPRVAVVLPSITTPGIHTVVFNWVGRNGPVAVNALRLVTSSPIAVR